MRQCSELTAAVLAGEYDAVFSYLYPLSPAGDCRERYAGLLRAFMADFSDRPVVLVSAPGRTEVGGNHTDHQHGNVLAAAVTLDIICVAAPNGDNTIRVQSMGYPLDEIDLGDLSVQEAERGRSAALIRGIGAWFKDHGAALTGFDAYTTTDVLGGSGLSSSAAFEVVVGNAINLLCGAGKTAVEIAIAGQYAENRYFGKPSGLMDQMASSVGGFVQIDFRNPANPVIRPVSFDLSTYGYQLCIVDTKGSHADLTGEYAAVAEEMGAVAALLGKERLREVEEDAFHRALGRVRAELGDRAALRALHFFQDNRLAVEEAEALERGDVEGFLARVIRSGHSSATCLQNVYAITNPREQGLSLALALSEQLLEGKGAWRVHGGGFAGTIQAFVSHDLLGRYCSEMDAVFGEDSCHVLQVRPVGGCEVTEKLTGGAQHG